MTPPNPPSDARSNVVANACFAIAALIAVAWIASWFVDPRPAWASGISVIAMVFVVIGGSLRRRRA